MKRIFIVMSIVSLFSISSAAFSFNYEFLHDSATNKFDKEDWSMVNVATDKALRLPDNEKATWKNPKTGHSGFVQPLNRIKEKGKTCRDLHFVNKSKFDTDNYKFMFCKHWDGWKVSK